jgi:hypothetical protein
VKEQRSWNQPLPCVHGAWLSLLCLAVGSVLGQSPAAREVVPARERLMLVRALEVQKALAFDAQQCRAVLAVVEQLDLTDGELNRQGATGEQQMLRRIYQLLAEKEPASVPTELATAAAR